MIFDINDRFSNRKDKIECSKNALEFLNGTCSSLSPQGLKYISAIFDEGFFKAEQQLRNIIKSSPEHRQRVKIIKDQPTLAGKFDASKIILRDVSPYEQMVAIEDYLTSHKITTAHTFFLAAENDDYIPMLCKPGNLFNIMLGSTQGEHKAPKYSEWALDDPYHNPYQNPFIKPLEALEIVRQPAFCGATVLKSGIYQNDDLDNEQRYGIYKDPNNPKSGNKPEACVELKGQKGHKKHKQMSAGVNFENIVKVFEPDDEMSRGISHIIEEFVDDNSTNIEESPVSPEEVQRALKSKILFDQSSKVDELSSKLLYLTLDPLTTPLARKHASRVLFS